MKAKAASNKNAAKVAPGQTEEEFFIPDKELEKIAKEFGGDGEKINLLAVMCKREYFDAINEILDTAVKAAGVEMNSYRKNFVKMYCSNELEYPVHCFWIKEILQLEVTKDVLRMVNDTKEELREMLRHFSWFSDLVDPNETGLLNVSDERFKEYMTT